MLKEQVHRCRLALIFGQQSLQSAGSEILGDIPGWRAHNADAFSSDGDERIQVIGPHATHHPDDLCSSAPEKLPINRPRDVRKRHPVIGRDLVMSASMAFVGGFVDAAGFITLAGLFTSHVTGNFVLIGDELAIGSAGIFAKLIALPVFMLAVATARLTALFLERRGAAPLRPLLVIEALLLLAFLTSGTLLSPLQLPDAAPAILVGMFAVAAMGVQNAIGRLAIPHLPATTVMTVNVAQTTIDALDIWLRTAPPGRHKSMARLWRMGSAIVAFAIGCLVGAFGVVWYSFVSVAVPIAVLLAVASLLQDPTQTNRD